MAKDPYAVLGLSKDASAEDIKKSYRKLSKEWHPDKHKGDKTAEDKFKEINEAYETLSDPQKKQTYDQFGHMGGQGGQGFNGFNGFDFSQFGDASDLGDIFGSFFGGARNAQREHPAAGRNREIQLTITLQDVVNGIQHVIQLERLVPCDTCDASGAEPGSKVVTCSTCGGTGEIVRTVNSFFGRIQQRGICGTCSGSGKVPEKACHTCKGEGRVRRTTDVTINVPAGIDNGQTLRIRGQGDAGLRGEPVGDLFIHIRIEPDPRFNREGADIRSHADVPVIDALLGGTVSVDTVQGPATVKIPEGMQPGETLRIRGKGLPHLGRSGHGDHYVTLGVAIPKKLSRSERKILEEWRKNRE